MVCLPVLPLHADDGELLRPLQAVLLVPWHKVGAELLFLEPTQAYCTQGHLLNPDPSKWLGVSAGTDISLASKSEAMFGPRT